jgi:hypothetical protein
MRTLSDVAVSGRGGLGRRDGECSAVDGDERRVVLRRVLMLPATTLPGRGSVSFP